MAKQKVIPVEVYRDKKREWRWRVRAANGRVLADSGEGYKRRSDAVRGVRRTREIIATFGGKLTIA
jgi:uncharacterized protein YegP (UPF0339 family)